MHSLHTLVLQGESLVSCKVYFSLAVAKKNREFSIPLLGLFRRQNQYATDHAMTPFVTCQGARYVMERSFEREIIPLARSKGNHHIKGLVTGLVHKITKIYGDQPKNFPSFFTTTGASTVVEERTDITRTELQMTLRFMENT